MPELIEDGILWMYLMLYLALAAAIVFEITRHVIAAAREFHERRYRFSLRSLLIAMTLLAVGLALLAITNTLNPPVQYFTRDAL